MNNLKTLFILYAVLILFSTGCTDSKSQQQEPVFRQLPAIQEIKPEKSAKIKIKRNAKDDYSWEISGDAVEEIIRADQQLRKELKTE